MEFTADISQLSAMLNFIRNEAKKSQIPEDKIYKIELAAEEALVNVMSYAFSETLDKKLSIDCKKEGEHRFSVEIIDVGIPFNPIEEGVGVDINLPIEDRKIGGLGIFMIMKLMDEVCYQRIEEKNVLKLTIHT